ncbi:CHAT domain-containing tetratricopeptide repeat protein [Maritimibacter sp. UBA3975]|uniref:CHAT domain-containing tetratricopeptide repeat protein n=1 Tax=Maritimibacter sp. UBA3975 TaxID=1946833 RepID=UPI000C094A37|nr:CHAT domain-containing tetratricopeptide repeat protein [Maritimibacter sp. UBA3975]MAM62272.1 hypothetical protein [Maritimibacter sp.]|tara:strand:+ start:11579 stop:14983 length:3405 start_codon:yes stop_codon:yes gene_type:complete
MWGASSRAAALALALLLAPPAGAQGIDALNQQAIAAYQAGDLATARALTEDALAVDMAAAAAEPEAYLWALNNLLVLMGAAGEDADTILATTTRAVDFAATAGLEASAPGLGVAFFHASALDAAGHRAAAIDAVRQAMTMARGKANHGLAAARAVDLSFALEDYGRMVGFMEEMIAVTGGYSATTLIDTLFERQEALEEAGKIEDVAHLIRARILIAQVVVPADQAEVFAHTALFRLFTLNYFAGNFGAAADALGEWAGTGEVTEDERAQLAEIAENVLTLSQRRTYGAESQVALGYAQMAVALARVVYPPNDARVAQALRERAAAEAALGQYARAAATLQEALAIAEAGKARAGDRAFLLSDLAANAWQRGDLGLSDALYVRADALMPAGEWAVLSPVDRMIEATNRAKLAVAREDVATARAHIDTGRAALADAREAGLAPGDRPTAARLDEVAAQLARITGDAPFEAAYRWAASVRENYPEDHADRALALYNVADHLYALGDRAAARDLLDEAGVTAAATLPPTAPLIASIARTRGIDALLAGDRDTALAGLGAAVEIHKAPENRDALADNGFDFQFYAWLLLDAPAPARADVDAALRAIQWTQVNRAAEAVTSMAARLVQEDPALAVLLKTRQDAQEDISRLRSAIAQAYATDADLSGLRAREARATAALADADAALAESDLSLTGAGGIDALGLDEIQARLAPGEVFVTFSLPGLSPERLPGLDGSSNRAIAITADSVTVGPVREVRRATLVERVAALRCEMAVSDPGCGAAFSGPLFRGSMLPPTATPQEPVFDWAVAHDLYTDLFGGIAAALDGADTVIIAPPGDLLNLPFAALVTAPGPHDLASAPWFIRDHAVSVLPSIPAFRTLRAGADGHVGTTFLGVGDPLVGNTGAIACAAIQVAALRGAAGDGDTVLGPLREGIRLAAPAELRKLDRLADTACEVEAMRAAIGRGDILLRGEATERAIKARDAAGTLSGYDVITFATHGLIAGERGAVAPGLVLTPPETASLEDDGLLTPAEIARLTLSARLVVLSACNTAAGETPGQAGLSGLAGSFFHAGARALLVTHWSVYSTASARISSGLVGRLAARPDLSNAAALRETVLEVIEGATVPLERHPSYWAAFAIIGA